MEIRPTTDQDLDVLMDTMHTAFGRFPDAPAEAGGTWWSALEMDRGLLAVTAEGRPVGTAAAYSFELTLPGELRVPVAGVTAVGVVPSHRRQGVLTTMMRHQLAEVRERGEFLAVLLATEAVIYRRFGYGPATYMQNLKVQHHQAALAAPRAHETTDGTIEVLKRADCAETLEEIYDKYRKVQPGALSRPHRWWAEGAGQPPIARTPRYIAIHRAANGTPTGYASYAITDPATLTVDEVVATSSAATTALKRFVLGHDLVTETVFRNEPMDSPLRWQLADFRAGQVIEDTDWLWVRLLDVPRALTARAWQNDGEVVLDVTDPFEGEHDRYLLTVKNNYAECTKTTRNPDLSLDVSDLGSIYLGGTTPSRLVHAGHIRTHHAEAAAQADTLFHTDRSPHCLHWF